MGGFHLDKGLCLARNEVNKLNYSTSHSTRLLWVGWWIPIDSSRFFLNDFPLSIGNLDVAKEQQLALMWASHISVSREHRLHHLCSYDVGTNEAHFVLMCPPTQLHYREIFNHHLRMQYQGSLMSFFRLNHLVNINPCLSKATAFHHSEELASLTPSWCIFSHINLIRRMFESDWTRTSNLINYFTLDR